MLPTKQEIDGVVRRADRAEIKQVRDRLRADLRNRTVSAGEAAHVSELMAQLSAALRGDEDNSLPARTERARRALAGDGDGKQEDARARARAIRANMNGTAR